LLATPDRRRRPASSKESSSEQTAGNASSDVAATCPNCKQTTVPTESLLGGRVRCRNCKSVFCPRDRELPIKPQKSEPSKKTFAAGGAGISPGRIAGIAAGVLLLLVLVASGRAFFSGSKGHKGPKLSAVHGRVLCASQPAVGAKIFFHPNGAADLKTICPFGTVQEDGSFTLTSYPQGDGAAAGDYTVTITWPVAGGKSVGGRDRLGGRYSNLVRPLLHAHIDEGDNELPPFEVH